MRKLLAGAVVVSHSVTPCAMRTQGEAARRVERSTGTAPLQAKRRNCDGNHLISDLSENVRLPGGRPGVAWWIVSAAKSTKSLLCGVICSYRLLAAHVT